MRLSISAASRTFRLLSFDREALELASYEDIKLAYGEKFRKARTFADFLRINNIELFETAESHDVRRISPAREVRQS